MAVPNWSDFVHLLPELLKLIPNEDMCSSCKRKFLSMMPVPDAISIGAEQNKLQLSKTQLANKMAGTESVPDWSGLVTELLGEIAKRLSVIEDFTAFRGVCASWRAAATKDRFVSVSKVPLLMLTEKDGDGDVREFYSVSKKKIFSRMRVPEAMGKRCVGAGFGWILTVPTSGGELNLVKPLSSAKIQLPNMMTYPEYEKYHVTAEQYFMLRAVLSANPAETSDFMLMVGVNLNLGFWRNGDSHWTEIELGQKPRSFIADISYYKRKLYALDYIGQFWMWDPASLTKEAEVLIQMHEGWKPRLQQASLVESINGDLLVIIRSSLHRWCPRCQSRPYEARFDILKFDTVNIRYKEMDNLDGDAIFIGQNCSVSVAANDFPGVVKANCIYFTDTDWQHYIRNADGGGADMGIYSVEDESLERFDVESRSLICPPLWVFPSL